MQTGYYRFMTDRCEYNNQTVVFPAVWTDWYYLDSGTMYNNGQHHIGGSGN